MLRHPCRGADRESPLKHCFINVEKKYAMNPQPLISLQSSLRLVTILCGLLSTLSLTPGLNPIVYAQAPITSSGLNTQVTASLNPPPGKVQYDITGGTRLGGGTNLFQSFGDFNVPSNNIANFLNDTPNLATSNILGRVTGGNISNIFGTIQTTGFGSANLFLLNPAGFLFGPNATVNVGGMVAFTSADYLRLADGVRFNAVPTAADALLSTAPVAAYGFLGSNPGAITVQGSKFSVADGKSLSLVGGNITIQSSMLESGEVQQAKLSALGGQINVASVASPGEISAVAFVPTSGMAMGSISISQGALLDVSADAAGTVRIRGGQLTLDDAMLSANTGNTNGAQTAIDIDITENLSISDSRGTPAIASTTLGAGDAGEVRISSGNLNASSTFLESFALVDTHTSGAGRAGNVIITTGDLTVGNPQQASNLFFIDSGTRTEGDGGDATITANSIHLDWASISTGDFLSRVFGFQPSGSAGNLAMTADSLQLSNVIFDTGASAALGETQDAGNITLNAHNLNMINGQVAALGAGRGGGFTIQADSIVLDFTKFESGTAFGPARDITVNARVVELTNGSSLISSTFGDGKAGDISITAGDYVSIVGVTGSNPLGVFRPSGIFSNSFAALGTRGGDAGNVVVTTPQLEMREGRINTSTETGGHGGNVTINADTITISGEFSTEGLSPGTEPIFGITNIHPSGIFTKTVGNEFCGGPCGAAGDISITTGSLAMGNGSHIDSGTSSTGRGGDITIQAANQISLSGTLTDGSPVGIFSRTVGTDPGSGSGGNITLTAGQSVTISDGASVSASSTGPGNTGNIQLDAGSQFAMTNSSVTTEANQAGGGAIKITTTPSGTVQLTDSMISASVLDGTGGGGSVNIDPQFVILQNSQILAQAVQGPGGNIFITTNLLLQDAPSVISASSQFGVNGTVTIQSPTDPAGGKIQPLGKTPLLATSLLNQPCAALAGGEFSSFTVAGRDSLPTEPGSWLTSPLATLNAGMGLGVKAEGVRPVVRDEEPESETALLSLRQIAPAGFLTQAFALDWSAGCQS